MNRCSIILQIPQPSTPTNLINRMYSNSPVLAMPPADRLSPQLLNRANLQYMQLSQPRTFHGHKNNICSTPLVHVMPSSCTASSVEEEKIEENQIQELSRGISGLYAEGPDHDARKRGRLNIRTIMQRRRLNVWSTATRGGSGLLGGLLRKPGRFKIRTVILEGTTKDERR